MEKEQTLALDQSQIEKIKRSKALYTATIYGFIALFLLILLPFLPLTTSGSMFETGLNNFNSKKLGNLSVTISMIVHSLIMLVVGIYVLSRFRRYKAAAAYSFYKVYAITILSFLFYVVILDITGNLDFFYDAYCYEYWYYVLIAYALGLILTLIGQLVNKPMRAGAIKGWFSFISWLILLALGAFGFSRMSKVEWEYVMLDVSSEMLYDIYYYVMHVLLITFIVRTLLIIIPNTESLAFMSKNPYSKKRGKLTPVSIVFDVLFSIAAFILFVCFWGFEATGELWFFGLLLLYGVGQVAFGVIFNKKYAVAYKPQVPEFKGFLGYNKDADKVGIKDGDNKKSGKVQSGEILWDAARLDRLAEGLTATQKVALNDLCTDINNQMLEQGIKIDALEMREVLAAVAASKLVFIRCGDKKLIKRFAEILSDYFNGELFFEDRVDKSQMKKRIVKISAPVQPKTTSIFDDPEDDVPSTPIAPQSEENTSSAVEDNSNQADVEFVDDSYDLDLDERTVKKYGVISAKYVSHHLSNLVSFAFIDNTSVSTLTDEDAEIISAVSTDEECVFVGKKDYLTEDEYYNRGVIAVPEGLRIVVFVSPDDTEISAHHEWVKYATVLKLTIEETDEFIEVEPKKTVYNDVLSQSVEEAQDEHFLTEEYWKKLDRLEEYLIEKTGISFDNKFLRQMERYAATFIACGASKAEALDALLANRVIPFISTQKETVLDQQESDFSLHLDEIFGFENIPLTKSAISEYGLKH